MKEFEQFVYNEIEKMGGLYEVNMAIELIKEYRNTDFYASKNSLIAAWEISHTGIHDLIISIFAIALECPITFQALVGSLNHKIKLDEELDRVKILADIVGLICETGLISIDSEPREYHMIYSDFELNASVVLPDKHETILLRSQPVDKNWDNEYGTGSVILGHTMNHHERFLRLSHLNRMNQIPYKINRQLVEMYEEGPKNQPADEDEERQWEIFKAESLVKYQELLTKDQRFFIQHKFCYRGRTHSCSYYLNTQGSNFKKAVVQLANPELVKDIL